MSIESKAFKGTAWLAFFKFISQTFSWITTIIVARILVPEDYGLMEMATVITGYAMIFSELGLGAAIIHRPNPTERELSSIFWFSFSLSVLFAFGCFAVAHPTALLFHEPRVIPVTQAVSALFLVSGLQIVPLNLLKKELNFKSIGKIEMTGTLISCVSMLIISSRGGGVWTLIGGHIIRNVTKLCLIYMNVRWRPKLCFNFNDAKSYLKFGIPLTLGGSLNYIYEKSDKFFAGRAWSSNMLGHYSFAKQLAQIPTDKIVTLINQVSFPAFSRMQYEKERFNKFYLNIVKATATIVFPLFVGGFLVGDNLIKLILNEQWYPMILVFRLLCLTEILTALNAVNNFVHGAQGRPTWFLSYNIIIVTFMPVSFYFAVQYGLDGILVPWFTTYFIICIAWIIITLKKIEIKISEYLMIFRTPVIATLIMSFAIVLCTKINNLYIPDTVNTLFILFIKILIGGIVYIGYTWLYDRELFYSIKKLYKK